ncbi:hypothetical protein [Mesorhizobium sp. Cs1299R1N3]|uniref:hypothetical protein n=1 Tax=Mesorhizobium sp. Cs1299R1N3 TaxID=3015173 RepID=UPI00301E3E1B
MLDNAFPDFTTPELRRSIDRTTEEQATAIRAEIGRREAAAPETADERLARVKRTPVGLLTDEEISLLDPDGQAFAARYKARVAREAACPGHERVSTSTREESNRGQHKGECRHCGKNMSWDSSD